MTDEQQIAGVVANAKRVAVGCYPELASAPFYVLWPSPDSEALPLGMLGRILGFSTPGLDLAMRPELERQGRWQGRGVAVVVNAPLIFEEFHGGEVPRELTGVLLHEVAHAVVAAYAGADDVRPAADRQTELVSHCEALNDKMSAGGWNDSGRPSFNPLSLVHHGSHFTRACAHAWHRCRHGAGLPLGVEHIGFGSSLWGLQNVLDPPTAFVDDLAHELELLDGLPMRSVFDVEPPEAYRARWRAIFSRAFPAEFAA